MAASSVPRNAIATVSSMAWKISRGSSPGKGGNMCPIMAVSSPMPDQSLSGDKSNRATQ